MTKKFNPNVRGDTIVEVVIAIAILSTAMAAAYRSVGHSLQVGTDSGNRNRALGLSQQTIESIKNAELNNPAILAGYTASPGVPFCILPSGGSFPAGSSGYCDICTNSIGQSDGYADPSTGKCSNPDDSVIYSLQTIYDGGTKIFTTKIKYSASNGTGQDNAVVYYKLPSTVLSPSVKQIATVTMTVQTNPDVADGLGPTMKICVNSGAICNTKNYPASDPLCPNNAASAPGTYWNYFAPAPEGNDTNYFDFNERCEVGDTLSVDYSALGAVPINNITLSFDSATDYNKPRPPHSAADGPKFYMDTNFVIDNLSVAESGKSVTFLSYPAGAGKGPMPPVGQTIAPYWLQMNWGGTATFNVK